MKKKILIATSEFEYDPSEVAIPWVALARAGHEITLATPTGINRGADPIMVTGRGLGIWKNILAADSHARLAYQEIVETSGFRNPAAYEDINSDEFDLLILPGGHASGIRPYVESKVLHGIVGHFFQQNKPVGAVCHGVLLPARAINPATSKSCLEGRVSTSLLRLQELGAWYMTRWWLGGYYRTYPETTVEDEVRNALGRAGRFIPGPIPITRDCADHLDRGFVVQDGNYLSARWPGDCHLFAQRLLQMLS